MTIYKTAYDTSAGNGFLKSVNSSIVPVLKEACVRNEISSDFGITTKTDISTLAVLTTRENTNIPSFAHPLLIDTLYGQRLCSDFRTVVSAKTGFEEKTIIKNATEFSLLKSRLVLNLIWLVADTGVLRDIHVLPATVYGKWISEGLSRRFALTPKEEFQVAIVATAFYSTLFKDKVDLTDDDTRVRVENTCIKSTSAPYAMIKEVVSQIENLNNIKEFCETIKKVLDNPRLEDLNSGILITILSGSWFGTNAREILAVAIEHPPTWIALVYTALSDRSYKNSNLSKICERYQKNKGGDAFIRSLVSLLEGYVDEDKEYNSVA